MKIPAMERNGFPRSLVTGGAGFLGSHLCDRLIAEGHEVICLDTLLTGSKENIKHLLDHPRFFFVQRDVTEPIDPKEIFHPQGGTKLEAIGLDCVLHLASLASPKAYTKHPIHTLKLGALGTYYALGVAKACGSKFLLASTSEVYGDPLTSPQPESYWGNVNPVGMRSCYDESKRFAEALAMAYHRTHGLKIHIARIFNSYGDRMRIDDGRVLPAFMSAALRGEPLKVYGDGSQTRSYCHVSDTVEGLYRLLSSGEPGPVNLGNPDEVSVLDLAHEVIEVTGSSSKIEFEPLPPDDPARRKPDISKAAAAFGWRPKVSRREGLKQVIPYFRSRITEHDLAPVR